MISDPRVYASPDAASAPAREMHALAEASLGAETGQVAGTFEAGLEGRIRALLDAADGAELAHALAASPSAAIYRHLWRTIAACVEAAHRGSIEPVLFALPVVIVAAAEPDTERKLDTMLSAPGELAGILVEHGALGGHQQVALSGVLCAPDAIDIAALPALMHAARLRGDGAPFAPLDLAPAPIEVAPGVEGVHLRFVVGSVLANSPGALFREPGVGKWGISFTQALSRAIARPGTSVAAFPRAPQLLPAAVATGRAVWRESGAALFASNAIRRLRASVGEPVAMISAHRAPDAATGGELRLSLSSPFGPREAEGFRCPLYPLDRVADVATMLAQLVRDCRVGDVRVLEGVHADRDPATGLTLMFKGE